MRIGVCTTDFPTLPVETLFSRIAALGFECVQFAFASAAEAGFEAGPALEIPPEIAPETVRRVKDAAKAYGLPIVAINGTFNMAHPDAGIRAEGVRRFSLLADAAVTLGCPILSLCTGTRNTGDLWSVHPDNASPEAWADAMDTAMALARIAEARSLTLAIETEANNVVMSPARARRMMDEAASASLKMILDPANLFPPGTAKPENAQASLHEAFEAFGHDIVLAHGKDIRPGEGIDFCATGRGMVDFDLMLGLLKAYGYGGDWVLHGIYDEGDMPRALSFARAARERAAL